VVKVLFLAPATAEPVARQATSRAANPAVARTRGKPPVNKGIPGIRPRA
jgi:hypothetical protein